MHEYDVLLWCNFLHSTGRTSFEPGRRWAQGNTGVVVRGWLGYLCSWTGGAAAETQYIVSHTGRYSLSKDRGEETDEGKAKASGVMSGAFWS